MKKILLLSLMVLLIGACTSTKKDAGTADKMSREATTEWWQDMGEPDSEYWWIHEYEDEQSE